MFVLALRAGQTFIWTVLLGLPEFHVVEHCGFQCVLQRFSKVVNRDGKLWCPWFGGEWQS